MRYFFDTEFNQNVDPVELISIGIVSEDGREYYAVSSEFDRGSCDDWLEKNVLPDKLLYTKEPNVCEDNIFDRAFPKSRAEIRREIEEFVGPAERKHEFWGYYADYDWYLLTRLWGWFNMPKSFPMLCMDVKQYSIHLGIGKLPRPFQPEHHALVDAKWTRRAFEFLEDRRLHPLK